MTQVHQHHRPPQLPTLEAVVASTAGRVIGLEREYGVVAAGHRVDARGLWPTLRDLGAALDPGDGRARRGPWGGVVTADGWEAEVAIPPVLAAAGCTRQALALAATGEAHLRATLPVDHALAGFSTHISVEVDDRRAPAVAATIARRFSAVLMLVLDRRASPGLLVRPRHGRLEIGGEFAAGDQLRAAIALALSVVLLAERLVVDRSARRRAGRAPDVRVEPARERYGWYVDRTAFGGDLYVASRAAMIRRGRSAIPAGELLAETWAAARPLGESVLAPEELTLVDDVVDGRVPLPLERPIDDDGPVHHVTPDRHYGVRRRPGALSVDVTAATWLLAALSIRRAESRRWLSIPGRALDAVLDAIDAGTLDAELAAVMDSHSRGRSGPSCSSRRRGRSRESSVWLP